MYFSSGTTNTRRYNRMLHNKRLIRPVLFIVFAGFLLLMIFRTQRGPNGTRNAFGENPYKHQQSYLKYDSNSNSFDFVVVTDQDTDSKRIDEKGGQFWEALLKRGKLFYHSDTGRYSVQWDHDMNLESPGSSTNAGGDGFLLQHTINNKGRSLELSDLVFFNNKLLSVDDRTGIVWHISQKRNSNDYHLVPDHILNNGDGTKGDSLKGEWTAVKGDHLYVGSTGKEWTEQGIVKNKDPLWVKVIGLDCNVEHVSWEHVYDAMRTKSGTEYPGYLLHEAVRWNPILERWFFLPRRESTEEYNDVIDETKGSNLLFSLNEHFKDIQMSRIGPLTPEHGFSAFSFIPHKETDFLAIKSMEVDNDIRSFITVLSIDGDVLMEEQLFANMKFEGVEFI